MNKYRYAALVVGSSLAIGASVFAGTALAGGGASCGGDAKGIHGPAARFAELDANKDGKLTLAELTASRESWLTRIDTNKDGVASAEEQKAGAIAHRQERIEKMFAAQDENKDGRLARTESHMPSAWFERADENHDGALTIAELKQAREKAGPGRSDVANGGKPGRGAEPRKGRLDQNGDGNVDRAELSQAAARQLARLDRNGDGSVTSDEFSTGRGHGRHGHGHGRDSAPKTNTPAPKAG